MKIGLIGYGKMGKEIEKIAISKGHNIVLKSTSSNPATRNQIQQCDAIIEFTNPHSAASNIELCINANVPVVIGSTGWYEKLEPIIQKTKMNNSTILYSTNFSIGVNLFFSFNAYIANIMKNHPEYTPQIHEIHHLQKLDAPSGTAITTAEVIIKNNGMKGWEQEHNSSKDKLLITHSRIDNVPGTHAVTYKSQIDDISISHIAHNRKGFAAGALLAAEWIINKKGVFTMQDVLNIKY